MAPPRVPTDRVVPLLPYDSSLALQSSKIHVLFAYKAVLDPERLRDKLWSVIEREGWEKLGARLRRVGLTGLEFHVPAKFTAERPAVHFSHVIHNTDIASHPEACHLMSPVDTDNIKSYPAPIEKFIIPEGSPVDLSDWLARDIPATGLHVISFRDATLVVLYMPHLLLDGTGVIAAINAWALALQGQESKIPTPVAIDVDPLDSIKQNASLLKPSGSILAPWQLSLMSWLRYFASVTPRLLLSAREFKTITVPASHIKRLRERAIQDLIIAQGGVRNGRPPILSDGDVLAAWWLRLELGHLPRRSKQIISLVNAVALRQHIPGEADPTRPGSKIVLSNIFDFVRVIMDADYVKNQPLGQVSNRIRTVLRKAQTPERLQSFVTWWKTTGLSIPKPFATSDMYVVGMSNIVMARLFGVDFSGAAIDRGAISGPLKPTNVQVRLTGATAFNGSWITGRDDEGNYWLNCGTWRENWPKIEDALAKENTWRNEKNPMRVVENDLFIQARL